MVLLFPNVDCNGLSLESWTSYFNLKYIVFFVLHSVWYNITLTMNTFPISLWKNTLITWAGAQIMFRREGIINLAALVTLLQRYIIILNTAIWASKTKSTSTVGSNHLLPSFFTKFLTPIKCDSCSMYMRVFLLGIKYGPIDDVTMTSYTTAVNKPTSQ